MGRAVGSIPITEVYDLNASATLDAHPKPSFSHKLLLRGQVLGRKKMIIRMRDERRGDHIHTRVFMGKDEDHLKLTGTLVMDVGEWQLFGAALLIGADQTKGHLVIHYPDNKKIVEGTIV